MHNFEVQKFTIMIPYAQNFEELRITVSVADFSGEP